MERIAKQVLNVRGRKGCASALSREYQRNWSDRAWQVAIAKGNYDLGRQHLNFQISKGGKIAPIDSISLAASKGLYDAHIMPKDQLTITVVTSDPSTSQPFNLSIQNTLSADGRLNSSSGSLLSYLVDNNGDIDFPVVGTIHVAGLTKNQCEELIKSKIKRLGCRRI